MGSRDGTGSFFDDETESLILTDMRLFHLLGTDTKPMTRSLLDVAEDLINGHATDDVRRRVTETVDAATRRLPPGFPELLAHGGVDPTGLLALAVTMPKERIGIVRMVDGRSSKWAQIGFMAQDFTWISLLKTDDQDRSLVIWREYDMLVPRLPESVSPLLVGRPLRDLMSHPVLDALGITITSVEDCWDDDTLIEIGTSLHAEREAECGIVQARAEAVFARVVAGIEGVDDLVTTALAGNEYACLLHAGFGNPMKLGLNHELLRSHDEEALEAIIREQITEWKRKHP